MRPATRIPAVVAGAAEASAVQSAQPAEGWRGEHSVLHRHAIYRCSILHRPNGARV